MIWLAHQWHGFYIIVSTWSIIFTSSITILRKHKNKISILFKNPNTNNSHIDCQFSFSFLEIHRFSASIILFRSISTWIWSRWIIFPYFGFRFLVKNQFALVWSCDYVCFCMRFLLVHLWLCVILDSVLYCKSHNLVSDFLLTIMLTTTNKVVRDC